MRNHKKKVKKAFCYQKLFWPFTVWINCSSDLKVLKILGFSSNFKKKSQSLEQSFLTVGQNNFGNKIPFLTLSACFEIPIFFPIWILIVINEELPGKNLKKSYDTKKYIFIPNIFHTTLKMNKCQRVYLAKKVKKAFCYQKLFWPFTVWINCSSDLKKFANSRLLASNFKKICDP